MTTKHLTVRIARGNAKQLLHSSAAEEKGAASSIADDQSRKPRMTIQKQSFSIKEFCELHAISRSLFYVLREKGEAPRMMKVGRRTLISAEAAAEWRKNMEHMTITNQKLG